MKRGANQHCAYGAGAVAALGGKLTLVATFPGQEPVVIVAGEEKRKKAS